MSIRNLNVVPKIRKGQPDVYQKSMLQSPVVA